MSTATTVSAFCATHPDQLAEATCARCGDYACAACFDSLSEQCRACESLASAATYHAVPVPRFVLMTLVSLGLYIPYWMYKQWASVRRRDRSEIWPLARALFAGFTFFGLTDDINTASLSRGLAPLSKGWCVAFLVVGALWRAPEPWATLSILAGLAVVPACARIWELSSAGARQANGGFALRHGITVVLGLILWAGVIYDTLYPEPEVDPYANYDY